MAGGAAGSCGSGSLRSLAYVLEDQEAEKEEEVRKGYKLQGLTQTSDTLPPARLRF